jgi:hypothetical protein
MEITVLSINGFSISLPLGLEEVIKTKVRDSYQTFLQTDTSLVRRHLTALTTLLPKYLDQPKRVLHAFGGVGATAQVIDQTCEANGWPIPYHIFWERDPVLVDYLREYRPRDIVRYVDDSFEALAGAGDELEAYDHIMFDPSVATIKTKYIKDCWSAMSLRMPNMIWLSDTACAKIHINAKFYEKDFGRVVTPTAEGYLAAYDGWLQAVHGLRIADAMREAAETYCVILPGKGASFLQPIPYM